MESCIILDGEGLKLKLGLAYILMGKLFCFSCYFTMCGNSSLLTTKKAKTFPVTKR